MNVFATLKTVFFGSKFLSSPVPIDGTPRRDLVSALNGLMPLCRTIPGVRLALDIREGQVVLALNWTPRTDGNAPTGSYHYIVSDEDGVREMADSQVLLTENGKDNLPGSMDDSRTHPTVSTEKTEKDSAHLKKDVQKKAGALLRQKEETEKPPGETIPRSAPLPALCGRRVGLALRLPLCLGGDLPGAGAAGDEHDGLGCGVGRGRPLAGGADAELRPRCSSAGSGRGGLAFV